jgi:hypothetical protein
VDLKFARIEKASGAVRTGLREQNARLRTTSVGLDRRVRVLKAARRRA